MERVQSLRVPAAAAAAARQMSSELKRLVDNTHLVSPSISLILSCGEMEHMSKEKKLKEIVVVNMSACYLINMGYLTNCSALRVCILSRNYISKMDALSNCPKLIKLDLHSNHITELPGEFFWREMKCLEVLYLHNNIIGDMCSIEALSCCPQLTVLTLYDTPISLVPKYRHFVVNSIWSLKALDNFVIADEELMEEWPRNDKFKALGPQYSLQSPASSQISTWRSELDNVQKLVGIVNNILAHHSPVHIIQRWVRGHLTRKKLGATSSPGHQGVVRVEVNTLCGRGIHLLQDGSMWVERIRRQGVQPQAVQLHTNKLQGKTLQARYEAKELTSGLYPHVSQGKRWDYNCQRSNSLRHKVPHWPNATPVPGVLGFDSWMEEEEEEEDEDEDEATVKRCLILQQPNRAREVLLTHWVSGQDVRQGIQRLHQMGKDQPQPSFTYRPPVSMGTRLYAKSFGCVSLAPFAAIQRAYSERERVARQQDRDDRTRRQKAAEDQVRCQLQGQAARRTGRPLSQHREDRARGEQALQRRQAERAESLRQLRHSHALSQEERHRRAMEQQSARDFNCRYTMMAQTSLKRQIREKNERVRQQKVELARNVKLHASQVKGQIKDYTLDRQLAVQSEGQAADAAASTVILLAARDRLLRARATVKALKARELTVDTVGNCTPDSVKLPGICHHLPTSHTLASASPA